MHPSGPPSTQSGLNLKLTKTYQASSTYVNSWNPTFDWRADKAVQQGSHWSSGPKAKVPVFWWISFKEEPVEIVSIAFEEVFPGAQFEFFASNTTKAEGGRKLISGTQKQINHVDFENGHFYRHYGFKITKFGQLNSVTLKNFDFFVRGKS